MNYIPTAKKLRIDSCTKLAQTAVPNWRELKALMGEVNGILRFGVPQVVWQ